MITSMKAELRKRKITKAISESTGRFQDSPLRRITTHLRQTGEWAPISMTIHTKRLPTFSLYAAHADEFGVTVFGSCRDEALNNLAEELRDRQAGVGEREEGRKP